MITTLISWEFLGMTSFLLITYYTLRIEANKSSLKALLLNKFGDFSIIFAIIYIHNILLTTDNLIINNILFNYYNSINLNLIGILLIIGALTKSAQIIFSV